MRIKKYKGKVVHSQTEYLNHIETKWNTNYWHTAKKHDTCIINVIKDTKVHIAFCETAIEYSLIICVFNKTWFTHGTCLTLYFFLAQCLWVVHFTI